MTKAVRSGTALMAILLLTLLGLAFTRSREDVHVIRIGFLGSPEDEDYAGAVAFRDKVESLLGARVRVEIYPSGQYCGNERECIEMLMSGVLDIHMTTVGGAGRLFPPLQAFDLPYILPNDEVAECVFDGPLIDELREKALQRGIGMRLMTVGNTGGWRHIATVSRLVRSPSDLVGLKIRATPSALQQQLARALGANPTPIAWSELYSALATGVVEGTKNSVQDIVASRLHEHLKYLTLDAHNYMAAIWWYSESRWQALPADFKEAVIAGFVVLKQVTRAMPKRESAKALAAFEAAGGTVYTPDEAERAAFRAAAAPLRDWLVARQGPDDVARLEAAVRACHAGASG